MTNRRTWTGIVWAALNYVTLWLQPTLKLDIDLCGGMFVQSTLVAAAIVLGLSATDYAGIRHNGGSK